MIEKQENVVHVLMPKQDNENEVVEPHAHIDGGDILKFTYYNLLSHPSSQVVFLVKFVITVPYLIVVFKPLPQLPFSCEKVGGAFFLFKVFGNT
jgi:hypothetical protein